ncbi:LIC_11502 family protein [Leptospira idonii]|uniref:Uncharacterized protein n=1 Tax=Leptospira idonii TaxID=1193500 RepID=A0A4R9M2I0_9LEPT|nr:hypothetical protein [Leptospira idonii]TGN20973.1 hypothetical protein EHS15_00165 [Leptospira idonii]
MNENSLPWDFNEKFPELVGTTSEPKLKLSYQTITDQLQEINQFPTLLKHGVQAALIQAILTLMERGINPIETEILPEYKELLKEIESAYHKLNPTKESNWIEECMSFGDKNAYHWEWKHYGSKDLF